jgi:hypothetical protein
MADHDITCLNTGIHSRGACSTKAVHSRTLLGISKFASVQATVDPLLFQLPAEQRYIRPSEV